VNKESVEELPHQAAAAAVVNVLIVDDSSLILKALSKKLSSADQVHRKFSVSTASNGSEAVKAFTASPNYFHLILMDLQMPVMDGIEAIKQIRSISSQFYCNKSSKDDGDYLNFNGIGYLSTVIESPREDLSPCVSSFAPAEESGSRVGSGVFELNDEQNRNNDIDCETRPEYVNGSAFDDGSHPVDITRISSQDAPTYLTVSVAPYLNRNWARSRCRGLTCIIGMSANQDPETNGKMIEAGMAKIGAAIDFYVFFFPYFFRLLPLTSLFFLIFSFF